MINNSSECNNSEDIDEHISQNNDYLIQDDLRKQKQLNHKKRKRKKIQKHKKKVVITNGL